MSTNEVLREIVRKLAETFNDPQTREKSYFEFYDDSLIIHGFPPIYQATKRVLNNLSIFCGTHSLI